MLGLQLDSVPRHQPAIVSVLCVASNSIYKSIAGVDVFDAARDCRTFRGSTPIVAHPPCRAWSAFCGHQAKPDAGEKELGPWCVEQLRKCGGILEHPAHSRLWEACDLPRPGEPVRDDGLCAIWVSQAWWGDKRSKQTWLLMSGIDPQSIEVPLRLHDPRGDTKRWGSMSKNQRAATPPAFANWLIDAARKSSVYSNSQKHLI